MTALIPALVLILLVGSFCLIYGRSGWTLRLLMIAAAAVALAALAFRFPSDRPFDIRVDRDGAAIAIRDDPDRELIETTRELATAAQALKGIIVPDRGRARLEQCPICEQLSQSSIAYNRPEEMTFGDWTTVELVLAPDGSGRSALTELSPDLQGSVVTAENIRFALRTRAVLSGPDFQVDPAGPQDRTILADQSTTWSWQVRPLTYGAYKVLRLELFALVDAVEADLPPVEIRTFRNNIWINIRLSDRAKEIIREASAMHALLAGLAASFIAAVSWAWRRFRKPPPKKAEELIVTVRREHPKAGPDVPQAPGKSEPAANPPSGEH